MEIIGQTNIDFLGKRKIAFLVSGILITLGLVAVVRIVTGTANLGIDFAGGTSVQLHFQHAVPMEEAREILAGAGIQADLQNFTGTGKLLIRIKGDATIEENLGTKVRAVFREALPDNPFVLDSETEIGPTIGDRLQKDAALAIFLSFVGIVIYIAMRFEFRFGVAAAVATFHDVLAVLGLFLLMGNEVNLLLVTALLTLAGYSLNDTVVVYDRIRENMRKRHGESLEELMNRGINQVLSRTVVTTLTTLLVLITLTLWGGEVLHDFALALLLGVLVGNYSSIFVASSMVLVWRGSTPDDSGDDPEAETQGATA
ncbi:MAG: protein translocase subunit SecF [Nitrospirota bacterium]|nr:protein translocase subunit SecF [Nitrospirota bacterium]